MIKKETNWEIEFETRFAPILGNDSLADGYGSAKDYIKEFISKLISQEREKWVGEIKKGIKENKSKWARESVWKEAYRAGWNNASDEIINLIQK